MRKYFLAISTVIVSVLLIATFVEAQPSPGFSKSTDFRGTGSSGSAFDHSTTVTFPGWVFAPGTGNSFPSIDGWRTVTASTTDNVPAVRGVNNGTYNTTAGNLFTYGVMGRAYGTESAGTNTLNNWGVFGYGADGDSVSGVEGYAYRGVTSTQGGAFRGDAESANSVVFGVYAQADSNGTGPTMAVYGRARTGSKRIGVTGLAEPGGATTNIGVFGTIEAYTTTFPTGTWAGYFKGATTIGTDASHAHVLTGTLAANGTTSTVNGEVLTVVGGVPAWAAAGGGGAGDIEGVTAGAGMTGGGASGTVTLNVIAGSGITVAADSVSIDPTYTQRRVSGTCVGSVLVSINEDGTVGCEADDGGSSYTAGDGLTLTASDFDITYTSDFTITADQLDLSTAVTAPGSLAVATTSALTGLVTATAGVTTPANLTTTGTGDVVSADDVTAADDLLIGDSAIIDNNTTCGNASTDWLSVPGYVGVGIAPNNTVQMYVDGTGRTYSLLTAGALSYFNNNMETAGGIVVALSVAVGTTLAVTGITTMTGGAVLSAKMEILNDTGKISTKSAGAMTYTNCGGAGLATVGDRTAGHITIGAAPGSCEIDWTTAFAANPSCLLTTRGATKTYSYTADTSKIVITSPTAGQIYDWFCTDHH